jgi:hypothetical protein
VIALARSAHTANLRYPNSLPDRRLGGDQVDVSVATFVAMFDANPGFNAIAKGMGVAMPTDFKRRGRKWTRVVNGLRQDVHLRRLMLSYDTGSAIFRLSVEHGIDGRELEGGDWFSPHGDWSIVEGTDEDDLARITAEVREDVGPIVEFLDSVSTTAGFCAWIERNRRPCDLLAAYAFFGRTDDVRALLQSPELRPHMQHRSLDIEYADAVAAGYALLGETPSDHWHAFAAKAVKAFRGRPPKEDRARWERVRSWLAEQEA